MSNPACWLWLFGTASRNTWLQPNPWVRCIQNTKATERQQLLRSCCRCNIQQSPFPLARLHSPQYFGNQHPKVPFGATGNYPPPGERRARSSLGWIIAQLLNIPLSMYQCTQCSFSPPAVAFVSSRTGNHKIC